MYKDVLKRMTAMFLCACMVGTSVDLTELTAYAAEEQAQEAENQPDSAVQEEVQQPEAENEEKEQPQQEVPKAEKVQPQQKVPKAEEKEEPQQTGTEEKEDTSKTAPAEGQEVKSDSDAMSVPFASSEDAQPEENMLLSEFSPYAVNAVRTQVDLSTLTSSEIRVAYDTTNLTYDGTLKNPTVRSVQVLQDGEWVTLTSTDYTTTPDPDANTEAGTGYIQITGINSFYTGTYSYSFTIAKLDLRNVTIRPTNLTVVDSNWTQTYNGQNPTVDFTLTTGDGKTIIYNNINTNVTRTNTNEDGSTLDEKAGNKKLTITANSDSSCIGSAVLDYKVLPKALNANEFDIRDLETEYTFDGNPVEPVISVIMKTGGSPLTLGTDYTVSYSNNRKISTATEPAKITIYGRGNYNGNMEATFRIVEKDIGNTAQFDVVLEKPDEVYTYFPRLAHEPKVTVTEKASGKKLDEYVDYTLSYTDGTNPNAAVNAGTAKVIVKGTGTVYGGSREVPFTIKQRNIETDFTMGQAWTESGNTKEYIYNKRAIVPNPTLTDSGYEMVDGVDYTRLSDYRDVTSNAELTITGIGNYTGVVKESFKIVPRDLSDRNKVTVEAEDWDRGDVPGTGNYISKLKVYYNNGEAQEELIYGDEYTFKLLTRPGGDELTDANMASVRESTAWVEISPSTTGSNGQNYTKTTGKAINVYGDFSKIDVAAIENTLNAATYPYTGEEIRPSVNRVTSEKRQTLELGTDYTIAYERNENASTDSSKAAMILTPNPSSNKKFTNSPVTVYFTIAKRSLDDLKNSNIFRYSAPDLTYNGSEQLPEVSITLLNSSGGKVLTSNDFELVKVTGEDYTNAGDGKKILVRGKGGNFEGECEITYNIKKKSLGNGTNPAEGITVEGINPDGYRFTGEEIKPQELASFVVKRDGAVLDKSNYTINTSGSSVRAGTSTITIEGTNNYEGSFKVTFQIKYPLDNENNPNQEEWAKGAAAGNQITVTDWQGNEVTGFEYQGGDQIRPNLDIKFQMASLNINETLTPNDYDIIEPSSDSDNNRNVGTASMKIRGKGRFMGEMTIEFQIVPKDIDSKDITWYDLTRVNIYDGAARNPQPELSVGYKQALVKDQDYMITHYEDDGDLDETIDPPMSDGTGSYCINAGKVTLTVKGKNNYTGEHEYTYTIPKKDIGGSGIGVTWKPGTDVQQGWVNTIGGVVYDGTSKKLTLDHFSLNYATGHADVGTNGTLTLNDDRPDCEIISTENTGDQNYPLAEGQDLKDSACINAGDITLTVQAVDNNGKGNYTGTKVINYTIAPKPLSNFTGDAWDSDIAADISLSDENIVEHGTSITTTYNRKIQNPEIQLRDTRIQDDEGNRKVLTENLDYTVTYYKRMPSAAPQKVTACKEAGDYQIVIEGKGNYKDGCTISYTILPRNLEVGDDDNVDYRFAVAPIEDQIYKGDPIIPETLKVFEYTYNADEPDNQEAETYTLIPPGEFKVTGENNVNATPEDAEEQDWPTLTIEGQGNYTGTLTAKFKILPRNINDKDENGEYYVKMAEILEETYCAKEIDPENLPLQYKYSEADNGRYLKRGEDLDYTLRYELDVEENGELVSKPTDHTNIGPVYGTVTGYGNYTGTREFNEETGPLFRIVPRSIKDAFESGDVEYTIEGEQGLIYDGLPHKPTVTLTDTLNEETVSLAKDVDYTVDYDNDGIDAGTRTITITGIGNYQDSFTINYKIEPKKITTDDHMMIQGSSVGNIVNQIYTGEPLTQEPVITDTIKQLDENGNEVSRVVTLEKQSEEKIGDYKVICTNNVNATLGEDRANVEIEFCGNYTGTYYATFNIAQRNIADEGIVIDPIPPQSYTTQPIIYPPRITYGTTADGQPRELVCGTDGDENTPASGDYTLSYSGNCTDVGIVTITITGRGNFTGSRTVDYEIVAKSLDETSNVQVAPIDSQPYTGEAVVPEIVLTDGEKVLEKDVDYTTEPGEEATEPGMATVVINGINNYSGTRTAEFKIVVDIGSVHVTAEPIKPQPYTGGAVTPTTAISFKGEFLNENTDYRIKEYKNNVEVGGPLPESPQDEEGSEEDPVNVPTLVLEGISDTYVGTKEIPFNIAYMLSKKLSNDGTPTEEISDMAHINVAQKQTYGESVAPQVFYQGESQNNGRLVENTDYTVSYEKIDKVSTDDEDGKAAVIIQGIGRYMGSVKVKFDVVQKSLARCSYNANEIKACFYDGKAKSPTVTIRDGSKTLVNGTDYTLKHENNQEAGVGKVIATGRGNYNGSVVFYYNINVQTPKNLKMASSSKNSIKLSWTAGGRATGYEIYRRNSQGKYQKIASTKSTSYTNTKLTASQIYQYKIRAYYKGSKGNVYSGLTSVVKVNTRPGTTIVSLSSTKMGEMKISWKQLKSAGGYEVYQSTSKNGKYTKIATAKKGSVKNYTKKKLKSKKTYWYKVRAYKTINGKKVYGSYSSVKSKKVK